VRDAVAALAAPALSAQEVQGIDAALQG